MSNLLNRYVFLFTKTVDKKGDGDEKASEIKACCASCNGSGWSGGVDGFGQQRRL